MTPAEIVAGAFRGLEYAGLLGFVGVVVMRQLARQPPHLGWVRPNMGGVLALALLSGVATVALAPSWIGAARVAVELAALVMCLRWGPGAVPAGFAAVLLLALAGHAAGAQQVVPAILVAKSVAVLAMLALAAVTWRRGVPVARTDAVMALAVMVATGLLAAFPNPPAGA